MANTSTVHIKTDFDCKVYDYGQELGTTKAGIFFNVELRKGEHELTFVYTEDENISKTISYKVENADCDYCLEVDIVDSLYEKALYYEKSSEHDQARKLIIQATEKGYAKAQIHLGHILLKESGYWLSAFGYGYASIIDWSSETNAREAFAWFLKAAEQGNLEAIYEVGLCYMDGRGVKEDELKAVEWFTKAANKGYIPAQSHLGYCFEKGLGVDKDLSKAIVWYKKAAEQGSSGDQYSLGCIYQYSLDDNVTAVDWYTKAAEQGYLNAQYALGSCYIQGKGGLEICYEKAIKWLTKAAEQEHPEAQYALGECYEFGRGVVACFNKAAEWYTKATFNNRRFSFSLFKCYFHQWNDNDIYNALKWYKLAAEKKIEDAYCILSVCYYEGRGVKKDLVESKQWFDYCKEESGYLNWYRNLGDRYRTGDGVSKDQTQAIVWYTKDAEINDDAWSQNYIGECCLKGEGVEKNECKAFEWFTKATRPKPWVPYDTAQYNLGVCYKYGIGVKADLEKAIIWLSKSAEQGNKDAKYELGLCYEFGKGVQKDLPKAIELYSESAELYLFDDGNPHAQFRLGHCYERGNGVSKNVSKAREWYTKAANQGNKDAKNALERLGSMKYLFFDTETTGIPKNYNAPTSDSNNWPRLVQLSWITTDEDCNVLSKKDFIIYPEDFTIPEDATRLHGITNEIAKDKGVLLLKVLVEYFMEDVEASTTIVGHNVSFDKKIIEAELFRLGLVDFLKTKKTLCTMEAATDYCKIPGYHGYKWPKLQELHKKLFGYEFEDAHNSMSDVTATLKCFKEMRKKGLI